jgi:hypothetical protein
MNIYFMRRLISILHTNKLLLKHRTSFNPMGYDVPNPTQESLYENKLDNDIGGSNCVYSHGIELSKLRSKPDSSFIR